MVHATKPALVCCAWTFIFSVYSANSAKRVVQKSYFTRHEIFGSMFKRGQKNWGLLSSASIVRSPETGFYSLFGGVHLHRSSVKLSIGS